MTKLYTLDQKELGEAVCAYLVNRGELSNECHDVLLVDPDEETPSELTFEVIERRGEK